MRCHPEHLVTPESWAAFHAWRACRGNRVISAGMGGVVVSEPVGGHLPAAGGVFDQDAWLMTAFDVLQAADSALVARDLKKKTD